MLNGFFCGFNSGTISWRLETGPRCPWQGVRNHPDQQLQTLLVFLGPELYKRHHPFWWIPRKLPFLCSTNRLVGFCGASQFRNGSHTLYGVKTGLSVVILWGVGENLAVWNLWCCVQIPDFSWDCVGKLWNWWFDVRFLFGCKVLCTAPGAGHQGWGNSEQHRREEWNLQARMDLASCEVRELRSGLGKNGP